MRKLLSIATAVLVLVPMVPAPARAWTTQDELAGRAPDCFGDAVRSLAPGSLVTLHRSGQQPVRGLFESVSLDSTRIALHVLDGPAAGSFECPLRDLTALEYQESGHLSPGWIVGGALLGTLTGLAVYGIISQTRRNHGGFVNLGDLGWIPTGAGAGLLLGITLPMPGHTRRIECE